MRRIMSKKILHFEVITGNFYPPSTHQHRLQTTKLSESFHDVNDLEHF